MSEKNEENKVDVLIKKFRENLKSIKNSKDLEKVVLEGINSAQAEIRALAVRAGIQNFDRAWVKKNVMSILEKEQSKKVLRMIEKSNSGQKVMKALERVQNLIAEKKSKKSAKDAPAPAAAPAEEKPAE